MPRKTNTLKEDTITITKEQFAQASADVIDRIMADMKSDPNAPADVGVVLMLTSMMIIPAIMHELFSKSAE